MHMHYRFDSQFGALSSIAKMAALLLGTGKMYSLHSVTQNSRLFLYTTILALTRYSLNFNQQYIISDYKQHMIFKQPCMLLQQAIV